MCQLIQTIIMLERDRLLYDSYTRRNKLPFDILILNTSGLEVFK